MLHYWISYTKYLNDIQLKMSFPWHIPSLGFSINTNRLPSDNSQGRKYKKRLIPRCIFKILPLYEMSSLYSEKAHPSSIYTRFNTRYVIHFFQLHWYSIRMKSNEDNKTWISNILIRNNFLCLKQVYCCLTFVCVYVNMTTGRHFPGIIEVTLYVDVIWGCDVICPCSRFCWCNAIWNIFQNVTKMCTECLGNN